MIRTPPTPPLFPYTTLFRSLLSSLTSGKILQTLLVALLVGFALQRMGEAGKPILKFVGYVQALVFRDRKSTRLNSSHVSISYAVFCLKKKNHISLHHYHCIV